MNVTQVDFKDPSNWPSKIVLYTVALSCEVSYEHIPEKTPVSLSEENQAIKLSGSITQFDDCCEVLHDWLKRQADQHLTPWLQKLSRQYDMPYEKVAFRGQKTRWGSCSEDKMINLNYKLLFLPARLVRYVLIHELCHTKVMDHSAQFWEEVNRYEPNYHRLRKELKKADDYLPNWVLKFL